ncbi:loquacious isoform b [Holotrichia oblita]|uniref:Loquacious isoform b n=1 Tax=Holotrichia oblita TaxID=644536 RepID=A0ACB9TG30_HOLOL|nr:loquacious isoform b [Holotrichia oblita]
MAKNTKTPVMLLQELAVKKNSVPEYELIFSQQGTHENIFHYQVSLLGEKAIGVGRSKKEAKHLAASKALEQLAEKRIVHPDMEEDHSMKLDAQQDKMKAPLNCIPKLLDICIDNKIPIAEYVEISDVGPPHCREFTYECRISHIVTRATAGSKKHAKQLAAKDMLNRITNIIPELQDNDNAICDEDEVVRRYNTLSTNFNPVKTNFTSKPIEYHLQFKHLMDMLQIAKESVMRILDAPCSEQVLQEFVQLFDIEYEIKNIQDQPPICIVNIHSDIPVTVMDCGRTKSEAHMLVMEKTILILKAFIA